MQEYSIQKTEGAKGVTYFVTVKDRGASERWLVLTAHRSREEAEDRLRAIVQDHMYSDLDAALAIKIK